MNNKRVKYGVLVAAAVLLVGMGSSNLAAKADSQAENLSANQKQYCNYGNCRAMDGGLNQVLANGDITQEEYDAIKALQEQLAEVKNDYMDMTPEEKRTAMQEKKIEILDSMLADDSISQDIYDQLKDEPAGFGRGNGGLKAKF